jgi:uncharacterized protein YyaL (SSP411 family)
LLWSLDGFSQSHRNEQTSHRAIADGYENMIQAALSLHELSADLTYVKDAETWTAYLTKHFWNEDTGGYLFTHDAATDVLRRTLTAYDDAVPNANATMLKNLSRLYALTGNETHRIHGDGILAHFTPEALANIVAHAGFANGFEDFTELQQVVIIGDNELTNTFKKILMNTAIPSRYLTSYGDSELLPEDHPAKAKAKFGSPAVFICKGQTCSLPITDPDALKAQLAANRMTTGDTH